MKHALKPALLALIITAVAAPNLGWGQQGEADKTDLYTNVYVIPSGFLEDAMKTRVGTSLRFQEIMKRLGVTFGEGASVVFNPQTGQSTVRNTGDQMKRVEAIIEQKRGQTAARAALSRQISLTYQIIETQAPLNPVKPARKPDPKAPKIDPDSGARGDGWRWSDPASLRLANLGILAEE